MPIELLSWPPDYQVDFVTLSSKHPIRVVWSILRNRRDTHATPAIAIVAAIIIWYKPSPPVGGSGGSGGSSRSSSFCFSSSPFPALLDQTLWASCAAHRWRPETSDPGGFFSLVGDCYVAALFAFAPPYSIPSPIFLSLCRSSKVANRSDWLERAPQTADAAASRTVLNQSRFRDSHQIIQIQDLHVQTTNLR